MRTLMGALLDSTIQLLTIPSANCDPLPALRVYYDFECARCGYITRNKNVVRQHYNVQHTAVRRHRGGNMVNGTGVLRERLVREHYGDRPPWTSVSS